jgi:hypothetical protein
VIEPAAEGTPGLSVDPSPREDAGPEAPPTKDVGPPWSPSDEEDDEVDRISLAFELSNLLQESHPDDE